MQRFTVNLREGLQPAKFPQSTWLGNLLFARHFLPLQGTNPEMLLYEKWWNSPFPTYFGSFASPLSSSQDVLKSHILPYTSYIKLYIYTYIVLHLHKYKNLNMYISFISIYWSKFTLPEQCPRFQLFSPFLSTKSKVSTLSTSKTVVTGEHLINSDGLADRVGK